MRLRLRRRRPAPDPLGDGVWRAAALRYQRAVERMHQVVDGVPRGPERAELDLVAADLAQLTGNVRRACEQAQQAAPSSGLHLPGGAGGRYLDAHRAISRAAASAAQSAQAAAMALVALRSGNRLAAGERVDAARRAAQGARAEVEAAVAAIGQDCG